MKYKRIRWLLALLVTALVSHAQTSMPLTDNGNGTWSLAAMPDYDVKLEVEYETDYSLIKDFTDNGDGTWMLAAMTGYNVALEVEYEDASLIAAAPTAKEGLTYTGEAQELITAGTAQGGTMMYSLDGTNFSEAIPTATEVGQYTV